MKRTALLVGLFISFFNFSQEEIVPDSTNTELGINIVNINLAPLAIKNFSLQYERVLSKKTSIALGISFMPSRDLPFRDQFAEYVKSEDGTSFLYDNFQIGHFSITPEFRWYLGKGYGKGFYLAPYYRFAKINVQKAPLQYESDNGLLDLVDLQGDITSHSAGLLIGASFNLGKHIVLDWWIIGAHYGVSSGSALGTSIRPLSANEQESVRDFLNNIDIPIVKLESNVTANTVTMNFDGPWAGLRTGLTLGYRF
jgi:hypothetical protein